MAAIHSYDFGAKLLAALGVPANLLVRRVVIDVNTDEAVMVYLTTFLREECAEVLTEQIRILTVKDVQIEPDNSVIVTDHEGKVSKYE